jgi:hypothetical protein
MTTFSQTIKKAWRCFWKAAGFAVKITLILLIIVIVVPLGYFAWRAGQPMEMPQFNGLTFYQYMNWRIETFNANGAQYQADHPDAKVRTWGCTVGDVGYMLTMGPLTEFYTLAGIYPGIRRFINSKDYQYIPDDATWLTFLSSWWATYEASVWNRAEGDQGRLVVYCRLPQSPPTPAEWSESRP